MVLLTTVPFTVPQLFLLFYFVAYFQHLDTIMGRVRGEEVQSSDDEDTAGSGQQ